jgi:membrane protein DedA with SNARE-associated domain
MSSIVDRLLSSPTWVVYLLVAVLVFAEDALFVGFVIPGETAAVIGGAAAALGHVQVAVMCTVVVAAAIVGDTVGYEVGRHYGWRLVEMRPIRRHRDRLDDARAFLARRGGSAVFLGRFVAFFRAVMPALAGTARMPYPRFLVFNATGGLTWGVTFVLIGYFAGSSYARVEQAVGRWAVVVVAVLLALAVGVWWWRRRSSEPETNVPGDPRD